MTPTGRRADLADLPPIPLTKNPATAPAYRDVPFDPDHPFSGDPLVDLQASGLSGEAYYHRDDGGNAPYGARINGSIPRLLARAEVVRRLHHANAVLADFGYELFIWDAYRPIAVQAGLWAFFERRALDKDPGLSAQQLYDAVIPFVSDPRHFAPDDPGTWTPHATGAAVDLTIRDAETGALAPMGAHFDQMDDSAHSAHFEHLLAAGEIGSDDPRLLHRRLLHFAMTQAGFVNYPVEFWHFDWGNQMYQANRQHPQDPAWYGYVPLPGA